MDHCVCQGKQVFSFQCMICVPPYILNLFILDCQKIIPMSCYAVDWNMLVKEKPLCTVGCFAKTEINVSSAAPGKASGSPKSSSAAPGKASGSPKSSKLFWKKSYINAIHIYIHLDTDQTFNTIINSKSCKLVRRYTNPVVQ